MKVVLREDITRLGKKGDVVDVAPGYARNFLIPKKLALQVEKVNLEAIRRSAAREMKKRQREERYITEMAEKMKGMSITIPMKAGSDDKLYGSVNEQYIAEALKKEGIEIEKAKIELNEPIKLLGVYDVPIKLSHEVVVSIKVWVVKE